LSFLMIIPEDSNTNIRIIKSVISGILFME